MIGQRIAFRRKYLQITQEELANKIGTTQNQVSKYESGSQEPTAGVIIRLANALETTTDWLLERVDNPEPQITTVNEDDVYGRVLRKLHQLNPDERKFLVKMLDGV